MPCGALHAPHGIAEHVPRDAPARNETERGHDGRAGGRPTGCRDDRLRVHGRRPLPGLADGAAVLRPPAAPGDDGRVRARPSRPSPRRPRSSAGRAGRPTGAACSSATTSTWSTSAPPATPTPRSRSPRSRPASTCCARSRSPTRWPRPRRWRRGRGRAPGGAGRWSASPTAGCRRSRWPGSSSREGRIGDDPARAGPVPAGLDRRPGGRRCPGGCDQEKAGSGRARRHRRAHRRPRPVRHRRAHHRGQRRCSRRSSTSGRSPTELAGLLGAAGTERGPGHRRRRGGLHRRGSPAARSAIFEATRFAIGPQERHPDRGQRVPGSLAFDFEDMNVLHFFDATEDARTRRLPPHPRHRARAPVRRGLVAARPRARLRARASPTRSSTSCGAIAAGERPDAVVRRRPRRCSACSTPSRRSAAAHSIWTPVDARRDRRAENRRGELRWHDRSRCSPASGPTCRSRRSPGSPPEWGYDGLEIACWGDHLDRGSGAEDDAYIQDKLDVLEKYDLKVWAISNHLKGQAVCDDPIDERHRGIAVRRRSGATATPRACASAPPRR